LSIPNQPDREEGIMVESVARPESLDEAARMAAADPEALFLSGGTYLLAQGEVRSPLRLISIDRLLPRSIGIETSAGGVSLCISAGATFQDILDSPHVFPQLKAACLSMVDRNIRNRATVGGNIGAGKSCSSLIPLFIALDAVYLIQGGNRVRAAEWDASDEGRRLIIGVEIPLVREVLCAFGRYSRTACDLSALTCAVAARQGMEAGSLRICLGGLGPKAARFPELERAIADHVQGGLLPSKEKIEEIAAARLFPRSDARGSAEFKRRRAAVLIADTLHSMEVLA